MSIPIDDPMIKEFCIEAEEALEEAEAALLALDRGESFDNNFNAVFRAFHSIKGAAGMFGLENLQKHVHHLESLLEGTKERGEFDPREADYFLKSIDATRSLLNNQPTKFELIDPLATEQPKASPAVRSHESAPGGDKNKGENKGVVFVIDDEEDLTDLLVDLIQDNGFKAHPFTSAQDALDQLETYQPQAILSDIDMPVMTGIDFLKEVNHRDPDLPVVFLSGKLTKDVCIEALSYGAFAFLEKPYSEPQVISTLVNATDRYRTLKLLHKSMNFIKYQFSDLCDYLDTHGKQTLRQSMEDELKTLIKLRQKLRESKIKAA